MKSYHDSYITSCFSAIDGGEMLEFFSLKFQSILNSPAADVCSLFRLSDLAAKDQLDYCGVLGQIYGFLYNFPLYPVDIRLNPHMSVDGARADDLYRFYKYCVLVGHCSKTERRACLRMISDLDVLAVNPAEPNLLLLTSFVFEGPHNASPQDASLLLVQLNEDPEGRRACPAFSTKTFIYHEIIGQLRDGFGSTARDSTAASAQFEARILKTIELCFMDLVYSPTRQESWIILQAKLIEYLFLVCDDIGSVCIPGLLPISLLEFCSESITFFDLCVGLRWDFERGRMLQQLFEAEHGYLGPVSALLQAAWGVASADQTARLFVLLDLRSSLLTAIQRVKVVILDGLNVSDPPCLVNLGFAYLSLGFETFKDSHKSRSFLTYGLVTLERALSETSFFDHHKLKDAIKVHSLCMTARFRWELFSDTTNVMTSFQEIYDVFDREKDGANRPLWKNLRSSVLHELSALLVDISLNILSSQNSLEHHEAAVFKSASLLASVQRSDSVPPRDLWSVIVRCFSNFRECQRLDPRDFRPSYSLAAAIHRMGLLSNASQSFRVPTEFMDNLRGLHIDSVDKEGAIAEMRRLFDKRRHQVVAMWVQEKPNDNWEVQLKRTYEFDSSRRAIFALYLELVETCDDLPTSLSLLHSCTTSRNQTATVRYMTDLTAVTIANIVDKNRLKYRDRLATVYEILVHVHSVVAKSTCRKILDLICTLHAMALGQVEKTSSLREALNYCHASWGVPELLKRPTILGKRKASEE